MAEQQPQQHRPEHQSSDATIVYNAREARRYTTANSNIQKELTQHALNILDAISKCNSSGVLLDLGCGSGLSTKTLLGSPLLQNWFVIGMDISTDMLDIADSSRNGLVAASAADRKSVV